MTRKMLIGMVFNGGYGPQPGAWRMPGVDPMNYSNFDSQVRYAQAAERGKFQFLFAPDFPAWQNDLETEAPLNINEPLVTFAAVARETQRIGLVATGSTTFNEPFGLARQFKALDLMSHGRVGWNAVPTSDPAVAALYGIGLPSREKKYERLNEFIQLVQAFWGSWELGAWLHDKETGRFADPKKLRPINLKGQHLAASGMLPLPPSEQGQPVIFQAGGGSQGLEVAGRYASGVIGAVFTIEDAQAQRRALRNAAERSGRDPDEIKFFAGLMTTIARNRREGLDRRIALSGQMFSRHILYLGQMLGLQLSPDQLDAPLTPEQLAAARPSTKDPRSAQALKISREGWSLRDVLAHGVIDYHPVSIGAAVEAADHMEEWFEAGAVDGFWLSPDVFEDGIDAFVDGVIPILQERGIFHRDYEGTTLRDHLGVPAQYGSDPRVCC